MVDVYELYHCIQSGEKCDKHTVDSVLDAIHQRATNKSVAKEMLNILHKRNEIKESTFKAVNNYIDNNYEEEAY